MAPSGVICAAETRVKLPSHFSNASDLDEMRPSRGRGPHLDVGGPLRKRGFGFVAQGARLR